MAKLGSITVNEIEILEVDASPISSGIDAADGSFAILTDGSAMYLKIAGGPTAWQAIDKSFIGLANVDNTSDVNKPVSAAQQTALNLKANLAGNNTFTGGNQTLTPTLSTDNALVATQGRVLIGSSTAQDITGTSTFPPFQILGTSATQMVVAQYSADINPSVVNLLKSRGALNAQGIVVSGDDIGRLQFRASDGVNFQAAASVRATVDGTPGAGSMPGRLTFFTTPSGSVAPVERMRIDNAGNTTIGGVLGTSLTNNPLSVNGTVNSFLQSNVQNTQAGTTASSDVVATADNGTDTTNFVDLGINSSALSDASWTINGANDAYLYSGTTNLSVGTASSAFLSFFTGGTLAANERMRVNATGQVGIGVTTPNAASKLQLDSTTQGFLPPRMTTAQMNAIATPPAGLVIFNTDLSELCVYNGTFWEFAGALVTTATQTSTSTTYAAVTELTTPSLPIGQYEFEFVGLSQSTATTTGIGYRISNGTATLGVTYGQWLISQAADGTAQAFQYNQLTSATNVTTASAQTANTDFVSTGKGYFNVTAAGTVAIQIRSEVNASGVSIRTGSVFKFRRIR